MHVRSRKYRGRKTVLFLALAILLCGFVPDRVDAASLVKDATLTVKQTVTGSPNGTSEKFEYELKALTTGAPMPVGSSGDSYRFTLNGNESKDLVITYDTVDTYKYQLSQVVTSDKKDYDRQVYTIENYVLQNGNDDIIIRTGVKRSDGNKAPELNFTIRHSKPSGGSHHHGSSSDPVTTGGTQNGNPLQSLLSPQTGDNQPVFMLMLLSILALIGIVVIMRHRKKEEE